MPEENVLTELEQAEQEPQKERRRSLTERLYQQLDLLEQEQAKVTAIDGSNTNTRAVRSERLSFSSQIVETAKTIILIKRRDK